MHSYVDEIYLVGRRESKKRFRSKIYGAWGGKCAYCGEVARSLDHILPRHKGGLTIIENLAPACLRCNGQKGAQHWVTWYRNQEFYEVERETLIWLWINQNLREDYCELSSPFHGLFPAIEQLDFAATYAEVDNTILDKRFPDDSVT